MLNQFKRARLLKGLQQKELAEELGVTQVTVSSWEHGKSFPSPGRLKQVADVLNTTVEELLKEPGKKEEG